MKKKTTTKTIHQKYAASMRLTKQERDRAYEFADSCGPALSASALYVKALKITLDLLQDPKKLKEVAPLSEELQELDTTRRNFANEYARQQDRLFRFLSGLTNQLNRTEASFSTIVA
jgi:hypothetical protein